MEGFESNSKEGDKSKNVEEGGPKASKDFSDESSEKPKKGRKKIKGQIRNINLAPEELERLNGRGDVRNNSVRTSKYRWWNFLPLNLFEQFAFKFSNLYFLVIMFMQMVDKISISNGQPAMMPPLIFVVSLSMIKDAFENYKRSKADRSENNAKTEVYNRQTGNFEDG